MKKDKSFYYCDLCEVEIKQPRLGRIKSQYSFREVAISPISGIYGLMKSSVFKVYTFEMAWGRRYTELCKDCSDAFTKTMEERRNLTQPNE